MLTSSRGTPSGYMVLASPLKDILRQTFIQRDFFHEILQTRLVLSTSVRPSTHSTQLLVFALQTLHGPRRTPPAPRRLTEGVVCEVGEKEVVEVKERRRGVRQRRDI